MKNTFVLYADYAEYFKYLTKEQIGELFIAIFAHQRGENVDIEELDDVTRPVYGMIIYQLDKDSEKYKETCERRKEAGQKGGEAKASKSKQKLANATKDKQTLHDNEYENDNDKDLKKSTPKGVPKEKAPKVPHSPDQALNAVIEKFIQARRLKKKPMTDYAIELLVKKLEKLKPGDIPGQIAMLEESIEHGWDTVYAHDEKTNNRSPDKKIAFNQFDQRKYDYDNLEKQLLRG